MTQVPPTTSHLQRLFEGAFFEALVTGHASAGEALDLAQQLQPLVPGSTPAPEARQGTTRGGCIGQGGGVDLGSKTQQLL